MLLLEESYGHSVSFSYDVYIFFFFFSLFFAEELCFGQHIFYLTYTYNRTVAGMSVIEMHQKMNLLCITQQQVLSTLKLSFACKRSYLCVHSNVCAYKCLLNEALCVVFFSLRVGTLAGQGAALARASGTSLWHSNMPWHSWTGPLPVLGRSAVCSAYVD